MDNPETEALLAALKEMREKDRQLVLRIALSLRLFAHAESEFTVATCQSDTMDDPANRPHLRLIHGGRAQHA